MISRRVMVAGLGLLAAGCSTPQIPFSVPGFSKSIELTWAASTQFIGLNRPRGVGDEELLLRVLTRLEEDIESPNGPKQGNYSLSLRHLDSDIPQSLHDFSVLLREIKADLVTVSPGQARALGESGVLLPLEQFDTIAGSAVDRAFFPSLLEQFRSNGSLYAFPVDAGPLMLYYDADYFELEQAPQVNSSWNWNDLLENARRLTRHRDDGSILRWGLAAHQYGIWWALWQNEAEAVDNETMQCLLQEPAATEALRFFYDLIHTYRVSPPVNRELWEIVTGSAGFPPAMVYGVPPLRPPRGHYHLAELPRGKVQSVPVHSGLGVGIAAQTESAETAYIALKGLVRTLQNFVYVPAGREAVAQLGEIRTDLGPEEIAAIQRSLEAGRALPLDAPAAMYAMDNVVSDLVKGDDIVSVVNRGCSLLQEYLQTGGSQRE